MAADDASPGPGHVSRVTVAAGHVVVRFAGQFDATTSHLILDSATTYLTATTTRLTLDLRPAGLIDSSAVAALVRLWRLVQSLPVALDVVVGSTTDETILRLAGLHDLLSVTVDPPA